MTYWTNKIIIVPNKVVKIFFLLHTNSLPKTIIQKNTTYLNKFLSKTKKTTIISKLELYCSFLNLSKFKIALY